MPYGDVQHSFMKAMSGKFAERQEEKIDIEKENEEVTRDEIEKRIKILLKLAYEELINKNPKHIGYPMSDYIACFLDLKLVLEDKKFQEMFNNVIPDYKDNWAKFEEDIIKPKLDAILDILYNIKNLKGTLDFINFLRNCKFDLFSDSVVVCNMSIASALYTIYTYASINEDWIKSDERINKFKKVTELLVDTRIPQKGWQYSFIEEKDMYVHTLSTWLSLLVLGNIPKEVITEDLRREIEKIKRETIHWLKSKVHKENKYCSWCFRPDEIYNEDYGDNSPNVVATAQAILALYYAGFDVNNEIIKCSIDFIKDKKTSARSPTKDIIPESRTDQGYQGIQHCLQALLIYNLPRDDEAVLYLLRKTIGIVDRLYSKRRTPVDRYSYYTTLVPLLWYLFPSAKPVSKPVLKPLFLTPSDFKSEFESFVFDAKSIVLVGGIEYAYAKLIPKDARVLVYCRKPQEETLLKEHGWDYKWIGGDKTYVSENINCVIVDGKKALLSNDPFKDMGRYNSYKYLEGEEVSVLVKQLDEILDINIELELPKGGMEKEIKEIVREKFPKQAEIMNIEDFESNQLKGILEYYKLQPEQTEEKLAPVLGLRDRRAIESELSRRGIFSRVFINDDLKNLLEESINECFTRCLVLDESSAYLLLNTRGTDDEDKVIECFSDCLGSVVRLYVTLDTHDELIDFLKGKIKGAKLDKITKIDKDESGFSALKQPDKLLYFTKNEKITIAYAAQSEKYGIITNSWEVATMCKVNNIKTFSIMKFLNKVGNDENIYRIFRVPVDEFHR